MGLFGFGKRMEEETKGGCSCTCGGNGCHIKVLVPDVNSAMSNMKMLKKQLKT